MRCDEYHNVVDNLSTADVNRWSELLVYMQMLAIVLNDTKVVV